MSAIPTPTWYSYPAAKATEAAAKIATRKRFIASIGVDFKSQTDLRSGGDIFFDVLYRVARFFSVQNTKTGKIHIPTDQKYTKWPYYIPNGHIIYQMALKYTKSPLYTMAFHCKTLRNLPKF
jgi:hypothetical protein